jgi:hypothetical protein
MTSAEELYQQARDSVAGMPTPDLDSETRRIWILIGALSDAFWRRVGEPGFSVIDRITQNAQEYRAESEDEIAIWNALTAPDNYPAVVRIVEQRKDNVSEYAAQLHSTIVEAARRRWESEGRQPARAAEAIREYRHG